MRIEITTDIDMYHCETCGPSLADGGTVTVDGVEILSRPASASCFGGGHFSETDLLIMALHKLGHVILVDGERPFISTHDDEYHGQEATA